MDIKTHRLRKRSKHHCKTLNEQDKTGENTGNRNKTEQNDPHQELRVILCAVRGFADPYTVETCVVLV